MVVYPNPQPHADNFAFRGLGKEEWLCQIISQAVADGKQVGINHFDATARDRAFYRIGELRQMQDRPSSVVVRRTVFGQYTFSETVGIWLQSGRNSAALLLSPFLDTEGFTFDAAEYLDLKDRLQLAARKYSAASDSAQGLGNLNTGFFRHQSAAEAATFIQQQVAAFIASGEALQQDYLTAINRHAREGSFAAREAIRQNAAELSAFSAQLTQATQLEGRKRKRFLNDWLQQLQAYQSAASRSPSAAPKGKDIRSYRVLLDPEWQAHNATIDQLDRHLRETAIALSPETVSRDVAVSENLRHLAQRLEDFLRSLDEVGLYQLPLSTSSAATTPRQLGILERVVEQLRTTRTHLPKFPAFYERQTFWYAQPARLRRILAPLLELPQEQWEPAFTAWYFERCLDRETQPQAGQSEDPKANAIIPGEVFDLNEHPERPADLRVDFTGSATPAPDQYCAFPLSEVTAPHVSIAGSPSATLFFVQPYYHHLAPQWQTGAATETDVLVIAIDGRVATLSGDLNVKGSSLEITLPNNFSPDERDWFLRNWEQLFTDRNGITLYHDWSDAMVTSALLSDGLSADFLAAILIRAASAAMATPFDSAEMAAIGNELWRRLSIPLPDPHPLTEAIARYLRRRDFPDFVAAHEPWRDTFLPLVITSKTSGRKTVYLPDGQLPGGAAAGARREMLATVGYEIVNLDAYQIWRSPDAELKRLFGV
ncbi:hypothetical protein [Lewinella sp. 4G2]|uniref:hypothetical protein n=1 Tax=Lewinella sp. 4G2 TaxID=1803372 RepID=UPI0007B49E1F|nr:hypothetical protein [Lewinella sp. 4G2]OAV44374.1 hypothetical protein A3850_007640 [Lewinella sp. 4G2]